jgi:ribA/ribD-fused uncharacterized protein
VTNARSASEGHGDEESALVDAIRFYRTGDAYGCFSNFSAHRVFIDGTTWPTTEHYFQAQKFADIDVRRKIQAEPSPMIAARMGRSREHPLRADWDAMKDDVMRKAIRAKIRQHADVRQTLLDTGEAEIIEHTANDSYWADGGDGSGRNMLGRILMEVRAELTRNGPFDELSENLPPPWIKHPEIERYSIGWRMGYGEDYICQWLPWYWGLSDAGKKRYHAMHPPPAGWEGYWKE